MFATAVHKFCDSGTIHFTSVYCS